MRSAWWPLGWQAARQRHSLVSTRMLVLLLATAHGLTAPPEAAKLIRCATAPLSAECALPPPPEVFDVRFYFGQGGNATFRIHRAWSPPYASLFWHLVSLGYYDDNPPFRVDYRNASYAFMAQMGWNLLPGVQEAWDSHRAVAAATPAIQSNTRGRITMGMEAVACNSSMPVDPCAKYRPACTAHDYCAFGGATQFYINYGNNSRLDAHGFAPFGEVLHGMDTIEYLGRVLGNTYGEVQGLCPAVQTSATSAYCIYDASGHRSGVSGDELAKPGAEKYVATQFPRMYALRMRVSGVTTVLP